MANRKNELDKLLVELPGQTPPSLAGWHFSTALRQQVQRRLAALQDAHPNAAVPVGEGVGNGGAIAGRGTPAPAAYTGRPASQRSYFRLAGVVMLALIFILLARWYLPRVPGYWQGGAGGPPAGFQVKPLQSQRVSLNDPYREAVVSIGRVEGSNQLLAAISKRQEPAGWQLIYTQPLNAYLVLPVKVVHANSDQVALILIAYQEQQESGYRYLILRFDGEKVIPCNQ
ncbi:MAG: hypothetical protein PWQ18_844 [Clostridia bacterium]|nr:hypothetical protein [Clostridia bacterium]